MPSLLPNIITSFSLTNMTNGFVLLDMVDNSFLLYIKLNVIHQSEEVTIELEKYHTMAHF